MLSDIKNFEKKLRPRSMVYLDPPIRQKSSALKIKTKSCKNFFLLHNQNGNFYCILKIFINIFYR